MNAIKKWWYQFSHAFMVSFSFKLMQCCGDPVKVLTFHFADLPVTVGMWRYNIAPNLFVGDSSVPSAVLGRRPKNSTVGLEIGIYVNDAFLELSDDVQRAACLHELGHVVFQHTVDPKYVKVNGVLNDPIAEHEADMFAVEHGYGESLSEMFIAMETRLLSVLEKDLPKHRFVRKCFFEVVRQLQERRRIIGDVLESHKDAPRPKLTVAITSLK